MISTYVVKLSITGNDLVEEVGTVTNGDGLYKDSYEENMYIYRGANPNNYVTFNGEQWRIISVNTSDNTIKIMRNAVLSSRAFDTSSNGRYNSSGYCNDSLGCNIWGSKSTLYDVNLSPITTLGREYNGTKYQLPSKESEMNIYLNGEYYNGLNAEAREMIKEDAVYKVGILNYSNSQLITTDIKQVNAVKWKGKIGLIDVTEYVKASINSNCTGAGVYLHDSSCHKNSSSHNWMYLNSVKYGWWTITPWSYILAEYIWFVEDDGSLLSWDGYGAARNDTYNVRPVVTLSPEVKITGGDGSSNNPYSLTI